MPRKIKTTANDPPIPLTKEQLDILMPLLLILAGVADKKIGRTANSLFMLLTKIRYIT